MLSAPAYGEADIAMLLSVCRQQLGTDDVNDKPIDDGVWQGILAAALDHGLIGPLHKTGLKATFTPQDICKSIQTAYLVQVANNLRLVAALQETLSELSKHSIEVAVLKGPAVALIGYGEITHREFTDLDLLVRPADLSQARLVLNTLGYRQISQDISNLKDGKDVEFFRDCDQTFVELHWAFNPKTSCFPLEATGIWDRLQTLSLLGKPIRTLSLEDTLIALCIHASKHHWTNLKWTFDIAQILVLKVSCLDWNAVIQRCSTVGCTRTLYFGIQLAHYLFGAQIPDNVAALSSKNPALLRLVIVVRDSLLKNEPLNEADLMRCRVEIHDRLGDRLRVAALPYPDLPRFLPKAMSPISGPLRLLTRPARFLYTYGFDWVRTAIVGR